MTTANTRCRLCIDFPSPAAMLDFVDERNRLAALAADWKECDETPIEGETTKAPVADAYLLDALDEGAVKRHRTFVMRRVGDRPKELSARLRMSDEL